MAHEGEAARRHYENCWDLDVCCIFLTQAMRETIARDIENVEAQLDAEAKEDDAARRHYGELEWPLQDASVCTANLRDRIAGYK